MNHEDSYPQIRVFIYEQEDGYIAYLGNELLFTPNDNYFLDSAELPLEDITERQFNDFIKKWKEYAKTAKFSFILSDDVKEHINEENFTLWY